MAAHTHTHIHTNIHIHTLSLSLSLSHTHTHGSKFERNMLRSSFVSENVDDTRNRTVLFVSSVTCGFLAR